MTYEFRKANVDDKVKIEKLFVEMLLSIYNSKNVNGYEDGYLDNYFGSCNNLIYVAEDNGDVIAYLAVEVHYEEQNFIYLDDISVSESYRNQGIGTKLIQSAEQYAKDIGINISVLHVEKSNEAAFRLYRRLGYEIEREEETRYKMHKRGEQND